MHSKLWSRRFPTVESCMARVHEILQPFYRVHDAELALSDALKWPPAVRYKHADGIDPSKKEALVQYAEALCAVVDAWRPYLSRARLGDVDERLEEIQTMVLRSGEG